MVWHLNPGLAQHSPLPSASMSPQYPASSMHRTAPGATRWCRSSATEHFQHHVRAIGDDSVNAQR